jgi:hypothetical protein
MWATYSSLPFFQRFKERDERRRQTSGLEFAYSFAETVVERRNAQEHQRDSAPNRRRPAVSLEDNARSFAENLFASFGTSAASRAGIRNGAKDLVAQLD